MKPHSLIKSAQTALQKRNYVATIGDMQDIAHRAISVESNASYIGSTYLRALVGTAQDALGMLPVKRVVKAKIDGEELAKQLEAVDKIHARFYRALFEVIKEAPLLDDQRARDKEAVFASRLTFARTAKSTLRTWIADGNSLRGLRADRVTKYGLQAERDGAGTPRSQATAQILRKAERLAEAVSKDMAMLERVVAIFIAKIEGAGASADIGEAIKGHKFIKTKDGVFWPVPLQERPPDVVH